MASTMSKPGLNTLLLALLLGPCLGAQGLTLFKGLRTQPFPDEAGKPRQLTWVGLDLYFTATAPDTGEELYIAKSGLQTPALVRDLAPGIDTLSPTGLLAYQNLLYFGTRDGALHRSNGSAAGTVKALQLPGVLQSSVVAGGRMLLVVTHSNTDSRLYVSDGTLAGTQQLGPAALGPQRLTMVGTRVFMLGTTPTAGSELWVSDGTLAGTRMVVDLFPGVGGLLQLPNSANPSALHALNNKEVIFEASGGGYQRATFKSDGSGSGAQFVADIRGPSTLPLPFDLDRVSIGGQVYFTSIDTLGSGLWRSDGTTAGTQRLANLPSQTRLIETFGGDIYLLMWAPTPPRLLHPA